MNDTETRLREALREVGNTLGPADVPSLQLRPRRRGMARRWGAPLAVAAAIAAVIAGVAVAFDGGDDPAAAKQPAAVAPALGGPKFFVAVGGDWNDPWVTIHSSVTGKAVDKLPPAPKGFAYGPAAAAGDGRTFFVTLTRGPQACSNQFMRFQIDAKGQTGGGTVLPGAPVNGTVMVNSLAASPDGSKLAYGLGGCTETGPIHPKIGVLDTSTGKTRTWSSRRIAQAISLAWTADGRTLGFTLMVGTGSPPGSTFLEDVSVRALDTTEPGNDIFAARVLLTQDPKIGMITEAMLAPDGRTVYAWLEPARWKAKPGHDALVAFSDGKPGRLLLTFPKNQESGGVIEIDSTGRHLLVERPGYFGRLDEGKPRTIPRSSWEFGSLAW